MKRKEKLKGLIINEEAQPPQAAITSTRCNRVIQLCKQNKQCRVWSAEAGVMHLYEGSEEPIQYLFSRP